MKHRPLIPRLAAVCFSMVLVSGYVFLRAGGTAKVMPGSKSAGVVAPDAASITTTTVLPGSKSDMVTLPSTTQPSGTLTLTPQKRAIFYGSKSAPVALPSDAINLSGPTTTQSGFALPAATLPTNTLDPILPPGFNAVQVSGQGAFITTATPTTQSSSPGKHPNNP